eukprot:gene3116-3394_t
MPELTVLTLNVWGLWLVSKQREKRIKYVLLYHNYCTDNRIQILVQLRIGVALLLSYRCLADYLKTCTEDIVLLQEVWVDGDAQQLIGAGKAAGLKHCTHFRSGRFGSGLVTLSRHPIIRHGYWRYASAGYATAISCGDFYAGKGVGWVRLTTPLGDVDVFNTHLHANYCHEFRVRLPQLADAWATAAQRGGSSTGGADGNPEGLTCHAPGNTYQPRRQVAERIDYIWSNLACRRAEVALQMSPAGISYSDHFAVRAVLEQCTLESSSTAAAGGSATSKLGPMKLGGIFGKKSAGSAETAAAGSCGTSLHHVADFAASTAQLPVDRQVATAMAVTLLLEDGMKNFSSGAGIITAVGGFLLAAVVYSAAAVPVLLPDVAFQGVWVSLMVLAVGLVAAGGMALLLIGGIADRSQQRALQNSYRQLLVWMEQQFGVVQDVCAAPGPMTR